MKEDVENQKQPIDQTKIGYAYGLAAFIAWGLLPIFWKLLDAVSPGEILANRMIWSFVFVSCLLIGTGNYRKLKESLVNKKNLRLIFLASIIVSVNWFTYIWAVNSGYVIQASLGYYINPLIVSILSITVVKEKFTGGQIIALILAFIGVAILTYQYGRIPFVALTIATTFAFYGLIKKYLKVEPLIGLALETAILTPFALGYLIYKIMIGTQTFIGLPPITTMWLVLSGVATATPLIWFANSAQRIKFSTIGFLQYIAPTISLFLGIFLFKEEFSPLHLVSFSFIWAGLIIYTFTTLKVDLTNKSRIPLQVRNDTVLPQRKEL